MYRSVYAHIKQIMYKGNSITITFRIGIFLFISKSTFEEASSEIERNLKKKG